MTPVRAVGIINGTIEWPDAREYLEACVYIITHSSCRDVVTYSVLMIAIHLCQYLDKHGEEKTVQLINRTRLETNRSVH